MISASTGFTVAMPATPARRRLTTVRPVLSGGRDALRAAVGRGRGPSLRLWRRLDRIVARRLSPAPREGEAWWVGTPWEAVRAAGLFDADWYRTAYPDVTATHVEPMWHYAVDGARQGRDPNPMFASAWYLSTYPDVAATGLNPLLHYFEHGAKEGRNPSALFDTAWYLANNPDVRGAGLNPLGHYLVSGEGEGRRPRPLPGRAVGATPLSVVLVSGEPDTPGHQYRVVRFADAVKRLGGEATVLAVPDASLARLGAVDNADVVLLWRTVWGREVERVVHRARQAGAVVLFDVDDLMVDPDLATVATVDGIRSQGLTEQEAGVWFAKMRRTAEESDACTCTTPELAARLRQLGKPTYVVPNGFDDETLVRSRLARRSRRMPRRRSREDRLRVGVPDPSAGLRAAAPAVRRGAADAPVRPLVLYRRGLDLDEFPAFDDSGTRSNGGRSCPPTPFPANWRASTSTSHHSRWETRSASRRATSSSSRRRWSTCPRSRRRRSRTGP